MDQLTGLPVRADLAELLGSRLRAGETTPGMFFDIDGLAGMTHEFGWKASDAALVRIARWLQDRTADAGAHVLRVGGDEFIVLLPGGSIDGAKALAALLVMECQTLGLPYSHPMNARRTFAISAALFYADAGFAERVLEVCEACRDRILDRKRATGTDHAVVADAVS
jgi:diguanylate cyclase (GGDEF)-like protein